MLSTKLCLVVWLGLGLVLVCGC